MRILVLGGTRFVGRAFAEAALAAGDQVTVLHRGRSNPGAVPEAEHLIGDRDGGLAVLGTREWDAVVDSSGYVPRVVRQSAEALRARAGRYLFVSTISVYADPLVPGYDEWSALATPPAAAIEEVSGENYGGLKVACEHATREVWGEGATIVRPGLIVGPNDPTDRFGYWVRRVAAGGEVLAPAPAEAPVQMVDARDLAAFMRHLLTTPIPGPVHAVGPAGELGFGALLEACREVAGTDARFTWIDPEWLLARGVAPWTELPLWIPGEGAAHARASLARALAAGLAHRPLADTLRDVLAYERTTPPEARPARSPLAGSGPITAERERELLAEWRAERADR